MTQDASGCISPELFRELYMRHAGGLLAYLTRSLRGDAAEAEGIVQTTFLAAWKNRSSSRDLNAFKSWIYTIAFNELRQRKRKKRTQSLGEVEPTCDLPSPEQQAEARQHLSRVCDALENLPDNQREAIIQVRLNGLKFKEAAEVLGVPANTVKTHVRRGLLQLADDLDL